MKKVIIILFSLLLVVSVNFTVFALPHVVPNFCLQTRNFESINCKAELLITKFQNIKLFNIYNN